MGEPTPSPAPSAAASPRAVPRVFAVALVLLGIIVAALWLDTRGRIGATQEELARRLRDIESESREARALGRQAQEGLREAQAKIGALEAKLAESQNQQVALEALYQELSRSRDEALLADVEQTLLVANQQLQVAGNVRSALIALQSADARLARLDRPQLAGLRKIIARDIERLKLAPYVDVIGLSARLDNLSATIDNLPLAMEMRPPPAAPAKKSGAQEDESAWLRFTRELWRDLRDLVRIQNMDNPDAVLMTPTQAYFLRENLKLRLLGARLALLARDEKSFKADLRAARDWLARYYDSRDKSVASVAAAVRQLLDSQISIELPDLAASLEAVRNYRLTRERGR